MRSRRIISIVLVLVFLVLTACEKKGAEVQRIPQFFLTVKDYESSTPRGAEYILYNSFLSDKDGVSMIMYGVSETERLVYSYLHISDSGKISTKEIYSGEETRVQYALFDNENGYTLFYRNFGSGDIDYSKELPLMIDTYDSDFNLLSTETTDIVFPLMGSIDIIKNGDYYYVCVDRNSAVTRYDKDFNNVDSVDFTAEDGSRSEIIGLVNGSDGNVYIVSRDYSFWGVKLSAYNSEEITVSEDLSDVREFMTGQGDYLLFCYDNSYIFGITPDGTVHKLMMQSDLENDGAEKLFSSALHNNIYTLFDITDGKLTRYDFTLKTPTDDDREVLNVTVIGYIEEDLIEAIGAYNRTNLNNRIIIDEMDSDDYHETFNKKVLDGSIGDIIIPPRHQDLDTTYTDKGVYEDLYSFLDADKELSREDFFPNVLSAMEIDGHLYGIWRLFTVQTYFAPENGLPPTYSNILKLQDENPDLGIIPYGSINVNVLDEIMRYNRSYFNSVERIGSEAMREALLIANKYPSPKEDNGGAYVSDTEEQYYYNNALITDMHGFIVASKIRLHTDAVPVGNPIPEGEPQHYINPGLRICISASSDKKDAAWDFVKYYLKIPFGGNGINGMPTIKTAFEEIKSQELAENAKLIAEHGESYSNSTVGFGSGESYSVPLATEDDYAAFEELISSCVYPAEFEGELLDIITEETGPYFAGQKSIDEVLEIIENRAGLYIAEKS
jgi:VCBS repeat-containing protein